MFLKNASELRFKCSSGSKSSMSGGMCDRGQPGRVSGGLVNSCNVRNVPGATDAPSRAWRAADNSPIDTNFSALAARRATSSSCLRRLRLADSDPSNADWVLSLTKSAQRPSADCRNLSSIFGPWHQSTSSWALKQHSSSTLAQVATHQKLQCHQLLRSSQCVERSGMVREGLVELFSSSRLCAGTQCEGQTHPNWRNPPLKLPLVA